jgi:hypothetical protein
MPTEERYEISEVGIFSAASNPSSRSFGSRVLYSFSQEENWEYHTSTASEAILVKNVLDNEANPGDIVITDSVFQTNADNELFAQPSRVTRSERCRFLNSMIVIRGDDATFTVGQNGNLSQTAGNHIHLTGESVSLEKNSPTDELKLAFSVANKNTDSEVPPDAVRILVEFASTHDSSDSGYQSAKFSVNLTSDLTNNRYFVVTKQLQELVKTLNFTWAGVSVIKISASVLVGGQPSDDFYVCLDAIRLENVSTVNPLYGLTGYSVIKNSNGIPIVKSPNTENYIEFRFAMDVQ